MSSESKPKRELNASTKKVLIILGLAIMLELPLSQIESQISSRQEFEKVAQTEVAKGWGEAVTLHSPFLSATDAADAFPVNATTDISVESQEKKRGLFRVPVYLAHLKSKVTFGSANPAVKTSPLNLTIVAKPQSSIQSFKLTDLKTGQEIKGKMSPDGIRFLAQDHPEKSFLNREFRIEIVMRGTGPLTYSSDADQDQVRMNGNWTKPKFIEDLLPSRTELNSSGFEAVWNLSAFPKWDSGIRDAKSVGFHHLWTSSDYAMTERALKYGILFVALTFLLMFILESRSQTHIHPLQYGLIGLSISVFYLLLLALSETIGFGWAYLASSAAVTSLLVFYIHGFSRQKSLVRIVFSEQVILSGFFYLLLSLEESAFLVGSLGLFTALAIFMTVTRKLDWYTGSYYDSKNLTF